MSGDEMDHQNLLQIILGAAVGLAFVSNLVIYVAFKAHKVDLNFARSIKPGFVENLYRQTPALHSPLLALTIRLATLSKILVVVAAIIFFVLRTI